MKKQKYEIKVERQYFLHWIFYEISFQELNVDFTFDKEKRTK